MCLDRVLLIPNDFSVRSGEVGRAITTTVGACRRRFALLPLAAALTWTVLWLGRDRFMFQR